MSFDYAPKGDIELLFALYRDVVNPSNWDHGAIWCGPEVPFGEFNASEKVSLETCEHDAGQSVHPEASGACSQEDSRGTKVAGSGFLRGDSESER